jgi:hypothetical protein
MMTMSHVAAEGGDPEQAGRMMREMMGPQAVDQLIRQAISACWTMLPDDRKTAAAVEQEIRRLVDRAFRDLKEDMAAFGIGATQPSRARKPRRGRAE